MSHVKNFDYLVIGGGSGGIASANRAARHGAKVALFEAGRLGGTCVNLGCVPKKVMWNAAHIAECMQDAKSYGFKGSPQDLDFKFLKTKRDAYVERLNGLYAKNLTNNGVTVVNSYARFKDKNTIEAGDELYTGKHILIATGGAPTPPPVEGIEHAIDSNGFFDLELFPKKVGIIGSGYIATEIAGILNILGAEVTMFLRKQHLISAFDSDLQNHLMSHLVEAGIRIERKTELFKIEKDETGLNIHCRAGHSDQGFDSIIYAIGRTPASHNLNLESIGVESDNSGYIKIDEYQNTTVDGVYAVGDITNKPQLTPVAIKAGRTLSERLFNEKTDAKMDFSNIPTVMFTHPPIGTIGYTEQEALEKFGRNSIKIHSSTFTNMYYALSEEKPKTFMKLITHGKDERVIGLHVIGMGADEMTQGFAVAMNMGATKADFDRTVAIHPTAAEEFVTM